MPSGFVIPVALLVVGVAMIAVGLWLRSGSPHALRSWMNPHHEHWMAERVILLGLPSIGGLLVCVAMIAAPVDTHVLRVVGIAGACLLLIPTLYFMAAFLPIPAFLYPGWARAVRSWRREYLASSSRR